MKKAASREFYVIENTQSGMFIAWMKGASCAPAQGTTMEEALAKVKENIKFYFENVYLNFESTVTRVTY